VLDGLTRLTRNTVAVTFLAFRPGMELDGMDRDLRRGARHRRGVSLIRMSTKLLLAVIAAACLQSCAVYVPPVQMGGLVVVPAGEHRQHREHGEHHRGHHDRDDD
jgi:hypothetical protein